MFSLAAHQRPITHQTQLRERWSVSTFNPNKPDQPEPSDSIRRWILAVPISQFEKQHSDWQAKMDKINEQIADANAHEWQREEDKVTLMKAQVETLGRHTDLLMVQYSVLVEQDEILRRQATVQEQEKGILEASKAAIEEMRDDSRVIKRLTRWLVVLTVALVFLTGYLWFYASRLDEMVKELNRIAQAMQVKAEEPAPQLATPAK